MYGIDVEPAFFDLGYDLFRDRGKMHATQIVADLTEGVAPTINILRSTIDVISAQSLFHLFTLADQKTVAQHLINMTKPIAGSIIVGRQVGHERAGEQRGLSEATMVYLHSLDTFDHFWGEVGGMTGSKWKVWCEAQAPPSRVTSQEWYTLGMVILDLRVTRL